MEDDCLRNSEARPHHKERACRPGDVRALPDAEEVIAYKMPGFRIGDSIVAGYAAFSKQCGLYLSPVAIKAHADEIDAAGLKSTKTGGTFSPSQPIADGLVRKLALASKRDQKP